MRISDWSSDVCSSDLWEEALATFVLLDDVIHRPGMKPAYIGGFREDQFAFLEAYLPTVPKERLLVLGMHIPLFEPAGRDTFRDADRERLFALLRDFPHVLVLSAHSHTRSEEHTSELQSLMRISSAVFCFKKK